MLVPGRTKAVEAKQEGLHRVELAAELFQAHLTSTHLGDGEAHVDGLDGALEPASGIPENPCPLEPASGIPENPSSSGDAAVSDSETEEEQEPLALGPNPNPNLNRKRTRKPSPNPNPN